MKKLTGILQLLFPTLFISLSVLGQHRDTLVTHRANDLPTIKINKGKSIYKVFKRGGNWIRITSDKGSLITKSETFSDETLQTLNGKYVEYEKGEVRLKGYFLNGQKTGAWITYDSLRRATGSEIFVVNRKSGPYYFYWENGSIKEEGLYINGERTGERKLYYENGNLALKEIYNLESTLVEGAYFSIDGNAATRETILSDAQFPEGMAQFYKYIARTLRYPEEALKTTTEGKVVLSFDVNTLGEVENIDVISTPSKSLGDEAFRVVKQSPKWIPGTIFQKPANVHYKVKIDFNLN